MLSPIDHLFVEESFSVADVLRCIDKGGVGIALLVDGDHKFKRTITDGDLRRLILSGCDLAATMSELPQITSCVATMDMGEDDILALMQKHSINQIPLLDADGKPIGIHLRRELDKRILLSVPHLGHLEREYVEDAFNTNWIAPLGPNVDAFEAEISDYVGSETAAATVSGTAAIHLALRLLDVGAGDTVLCSDFTFVASAAPILYQGAKPVFIDSDLESWNMSPHALRSALSDLAKKDVHPKALIVVHLYGGCADMDEILSIAAEYNVPVIEDAAESLGSTYKGKQSGTLGEYGVYSFNGNKIITTSGGGMLVGNCKESLQRARFLSTQAKNAAPYYEHTEIGYNYRMSNVLAGIGRGQLQVLDDRVAMRQRIFETYNQALKDIPELIWMPLVDGCKSNRWLSTAILDPTKTTITVADFIDILAKNNIEARYVWKPMHMQPVFAKNDFYQHLPDFNCSAYLFEHGICLPSASSMTEEEQTTVIECIRNIFK